MKFGICGIMTDRGIQPVALARWVEDQGFESLWFGEHTHTPDPERTAARDPAGYDELYNPYAVLAAAAAVTTGIGLGLSVALVPQHHPIELAKMVATLDRLSNGRFLLGVGAGYRVGEIADFGVRFEDRWKVLREHVQAMRAIWSNAVAEFSGRFVSFGPMRAWPKPVRPGGPPVLEGAFSKYTARRIAEYGDGWIAWDGMTLEELAALAAEIRDEWAKAGRPAAALDLSIVIRAPIAAGDTNARIQALAGIGFGRIVFLMTPGAPAEQWQELTWFARVMRENR